MKRIVLIISTLFFLSSCEDEIVSPIPNYPVNFQLDLQMVDDRALWDIFGAKTYTSQRLSSDRLGFGGILVVNGIGDKVLNLYAFDLSCPVEISRDALLKPDDTGKAVCEKCGAVFSIGYGAGNPLSGSKNFLKRYVVSEIGNERFRVTN